MAWWKFWEKKQIRNNELPKERLENLALTNYFLAEIRKKLKIKGEVFTKWYIGGYFNGAFLVGESIEYGADFYFSEKEIDFRDYWTVAKLGNIWFSTTNKNEYKFDYEEEARKINENFNKLLEIRGRGILSQVSRFSISITCRENEASQLKVKEFINEIIAEFSNPKVETSCLVLPLEVPEYVYDVEVIFDKPISEDKFVEKLKKYFPSINKRLFGAGYFENNPNPNLKFSINALYCRHF